MKRWIGFASALLLAAAGQAQEQPLDRVLACMRANIPDTVRIQTVEIVAVDRVGGERELRGKLYGMLDGGRVQVMMRIEQPPDLAGAAYLVREGESADEMYLFLPAVNKVRRITGASLDGQLWGTDLSYNDVKNIQNAFAGADVKLEAPGQQEQRPVHVLSFTPRAEDGSRYTRIRTHVDKKTCVALRVEFHEPSGIRKTLTVRPADLKQSGKHWYAAAAVIEDVQNGTRTRLKVTGLRSGDKLATRYFNPQSFYLGH